MNGLLCLLIFLLGVTVGVQRDWLADWRPARPLVASDIPLLPEGTEIVNVQESFYTPDDGILFHHNKIDGLYFNVVPEPKGDR